MDRHIFIPDRIFYERPFLTAKPEYRLIIYNNELISKFKVADNCTSENKSQFRLAELKHECLPTTLAFKTQGKSSFGVFFQNEE